MSNTPKKQRGRPQKASSTLSAESIVQQAKYLMKNDKKIPSIRQLAQSLDVDAMAIYYYFANKNALLEAMTTSLVSDIYEPQTGATEQWQPELTKLARSYLTILNEYDGLLDTLLTMGAESPAHVFINRFEKIVAHLALSTERQTAFLHVFVDYLHGFSVALSKDASGVLTIEATEAPLNFLYQALHCDS